jgi:hypothetical protein
MRRMLKWRPSPALVISIIALFAAIGGVAGALPGKNKVDSGDIRKNAIKSADIAPNAAKGADVKESSFGVVPNAANAANAGAIGGNRVLRFQLIGPAPIGNTMILDLGGLQLFASCPAGAVNLTATTTVGDGEISTTTTNGGDGSQGINADTDFNPGEVFGLANPGNQNEVGEGRYVGGDLRSVHFSYYEALSSGANNCLMTGFAIGS